MSQGAPELIEPSDLWLALTALPRPHRVVPFPRMLPGSDAPVGELAIWPLTQEEQMAANAEADRWTKRLLKDPQLKDQANLGYHHTYANEVAIQVLWRACRDPKRIERAAFPSPALMRERLTTDEVDVDRILRIVGEARASEAKAAADAEARGFQAGSRAASASKPLCPDGK